MTEPLDDGPVLHLAVGDARTVQQAGVQFARDLAGAGRADFMLALAEQADLIRRAIVDAGFNNDQAQNAAEVFELAALIEWERLARAMASDTSGTA